MDVPTAKSVCWETGFNPDTLLTLSVSLSQVGWMVLANWLNGVLADQLDDTIQDLRAACISKRLADLRHREEILDLAHNSEPFMF